jgi:hypothetical protein
MLMGFIDHVEAQRRKRFGQFFGDTISGAHTGGLAGAERLGQCR